MISEIANSLFLTYLASEYLLSSSSSSSSSPRSSRTIHHRADKDIIDPKKRANKDNYVVLVCLAFLVGIANLLDHHYYLSVIWKYTTRIIPNNIPNIPGVPSYFLVIPTKLCCAAASYVVALYIDIHRDRTNGKRNENSNSSHHDNKNKTKPKIPFRSVFLPKVGWAFLKILPAYPFLAVIISFVFLFVVDLWEFVFHLPLEWLNNPIYYGTLYGPFAYTYVHVKNEVLRKNPHNDYSTRNRGYGHNSNMYNNKNNGFGNNQTRNDALV